MNEKTGDKLKNTGVENFIPRTIQRAIRTSLEVLTAALALPEARIDAATEAACRALAGRDTEPDGDGQRLNGIVTIREAAKLLHRSTKTISEMVKRGVIIGLHGGSAKQRTTGIVRSSLMRYLDGGSPTNEEVAR